jgi:hypothetical protein
VRQRRQRVRFVRFAAAVAKDQHIPSILPLQGASQDDPQRKLGFQILQTMDGAIDAAIQQRLVNFLREQALAADIRQRTVLHRIAGGGDHGFLALSRTGDSGEQAQKRTRLHQRQRGAARAGAKQWLSSLGHKRLIALARRTDE